MFLYFFKKQVTKQVFVQHGVPWYRSVAWCIFSWPCNPHSLKGPSMPNRCCDIHMTSPNWSFMGWLLFLVVSNPFRKRFKSYKISSKVNFLKNKNIFYWFMGVNIRFIYLTSDRIWCNAHKKLTQRTLRALNNQVNRSDGPWDMIKRVQTIHYVRFWPPPNQKPDS